MTTDTPLITRSDDLAWGASSSPGTRVPVGCAVRYLEAGDALDAFLRSSSRPSAAVRHWPGRRVSLAQRTREEAVPA